MGLSREARIITLLVIDTAFFFLELIVGYAVGSLALVADSFHMLNDVLSLIVALYTIKLATSPSSSANSYGWQRAEILGALINGVFLIALCTSIGLEAIGRMISPPEITTPKLIVIVGSLGLLSNIVGLFLFHDHGHGHGAHGHDHGHSHGAVSLPQEDDEPLHPEAQSIPRRRSDSLTFPYQHPAETRAQIIEAARVGASYEGDSYVGSHHRHASTASSHRRKSRPFVPAKAPQPGTNETMAPTSREREPAVSTPSTATVVEEPVSPKSTPANGGHAANANDAELGHAHSHDHDHGSSTPTKEVAGHGHAHGSMNMRGVFLHVLGDALGNVGVISAGLVIWFCEGRWTLYFDPGVSLLITCIIFSSAMPLVKSASKILMQGVPEHVSLEAVRESIKAVDGVVSVHDLHVWQLSETTTVASVHVLILPDKDYMEVANSIRKELHAHGIHSVTIQPEFYDGSGAISDSDEDEENTCLIRCPPEQCDATVTCCPPTKTSTPTPRLDHVSEGEESNHSH